MVGRKDGRPKIAVLGAGAAGLSAAYSAHKLGADVDVYEARSTVGGALRSYPAVPGDDRAISTGFTYDVGAGSMQMKHPQVADVIMEMSGLGLVPLSRSKDKRTTYVVHEGEVLPLPKNPAALIACKLLSLRTKLGILLEPFAPPPAENDGKEGPESVHAFFSRRFSPEIATRIVEPAMGGIYAANADALPMRYALPSVWETEKLDGSVLIPMMKKGFSSTKDSRKLRESITFQNGMQALPQTLQSYLEQHGERARVRTGEKVQRLWRRQDGTWQVNRLRERYDAVVCTLPSYVLPAINTNVSYAEKVFLRLASWVKYAPMTVTVLGYPRAAVGHALDGVGILLPRAESKRRNGVLGIQFSSEGYAQKIGANDQNYVYITVYSGGTRNPRYCLLPPEQVEHNSHTEVSKLLAIQPGVQPSFSAVQIWDKAIPQPTRRTSRVKRSVRWLENRSPGLLIAGSYVDGVGVPDAILSGLNASKRALRYVDTLEAIMNKANGNKVITAAAEQ